VYKNSSNAAAGSSGLTYDGTDLAISSGKLAVNTRAGDEGGEIFLVNSVTNTSISNGVTIDIWQNRLRFFEQGGSARGFYLDITQGGAGVSTDLATGPLSINSQTASYTLVLTDKGKMVEMYNASANNLTIPLNSSVAFDIGTTITILQTGAGQTTIVATGGVTVNGTPGLKLRAQWSLVTLVKRATDTWVVSGDLTA
jgi:hypothetical protein